MTEEENILEKYPQLKEIDDTQERYQEYIGILNEQYESNFKYEIKEEYENIP